MKNQETYPPNGRINRLIAKVSRPRILFWTLLLILLLVNYRHLTDPPYWDGLVGVYSQGSWLLRNHLNYGQLRLEAPFMQGGPNVDLFYAYSLLFAVLSSVMRPAAVFLVFHLLTLICASATIVFFVEMIRKRRPLWPWLLWIFSAAADPIWSGQTASMYLEVPLAAFLGASLYSVWRRWYGWAAVACLAAWFIKGTAFLQAICFAVFAIAYGLWLHFRKKQSFDARMAALLVPLPVMLILKRWVVLAPFATTWNVTDAFQAFLHRSTALYPIAAFELGLVLFFLLMVLIKRQRTLPAALLADHPLLGMLMLYVLSFWVAFLIYPFALPRYLCVVLFPQALLLAFMMSGKPKLSALLAGSILLINLLNQQGRFLPPLPSAEGRSGHELERSREYLLDLDANRRLCQRLERLEYPGPIMTKWPFTQMLRLPELGYVSRPLPRLIEAGLYSKVTGAVPLERFLQEKPLPVTLCVYAPNVFDLRWGASLAPMKRDVVYLEDHTLFPPVIVYARDWERVKRDYMASQRLRRS